MRLSRAGVAVVGMILAAACSKGSPSQATFTEPPFTPEVTLAPSATPAAAASSNQLQFEPLTGQTIILHITGFQVGESVTFTITKPDGSSFTGPSHIVAQDGSVEARYSPPQSGTYTILAKGDKGDQAQGQFTASGTVTSGPKTTSKPFVHHTATPHPTAHASATPHTPSPTHT